MDMNIKKMKEHKRYLNDIEYQNEEESLFLPNYYFDKHSVFSSQQAYKALLQCLQSFNAKSEKKILHVT